MIGDNMFGLSNTLIGTERLAYRLMWAYARMGAAVRPIDVKVTTAEFSGMCKAANAFGYGNTETAVWMTVMDVMTDHPQPRYNATNAAERIEWERNSTAHLTVELDKIK